MKTTKLSTEIAIQILRSFGAIWPNELLPNEFYYLNDIKIESDIGQESYKLYGAELSTDKDKLSLIFSNIDNSYYCVWIVSSFVFGIILIIESTTDGNIYKLNPEGWKELPDKAKANMLVGSYILADHVPVLSKLNNYTEIVKHFYSLIELDVE